MRIRMLIVSTLATLAVSGLLAATGSAERTQEVRGAAPVAKVAKGKAKAKTPASAVALARILRAQACAIAEMSRSAGPGYCRQGDGRPPRR